MKRETTVTFKRAVGTFFFYIIIIILSYIGYYYV